MRPTIWNERFQRQFNEALVISTFMTLSDAGMGCFVIYLMMYFNHQGYCAGKIGCNFPERGSMTRRDTNSSYENQNCAEIEAFRNCTQDSIPNGTRNTLIGGSVGAMITLIICIAIIVDMIKKQKQHLADTELTPINQHKI